VGGPITVVEAQLSAPNGRVQVVSVGVVTNGQPVSYQSTQLVEVVVRPGSTTTGPEGELVVIPPVTRFELRPVSVSLGSGGEVNPQNLSMPNLTAGSISMAPGGSFAV